MTPGRVLLRVVVLYGLVLHGAAGAQVALDQFEPAPLASDGFALAGPQLLAPRHHTLSLAADYARDPLTYRINSAAHTRQVVVGDQLVFHPGGAYAPHRRVLLFASLPVHAIMRSRDELFLAGTEPDGAALGDLRLGARFGLLGAARGRDALSAELIARLPTAELADRDQHYAGDRIGSYDGAVLGGLQIARAELRARIGVRLRETTELSNLTLGSALTFAVGVRAPVANVVVLHAEFLGSTFLSSAFEPKHTPIEMLLGGKYQLREWSLGAAAGPGFGSGYGSPSVRAVATLGFSPRVEAPRPPAPVVQDPDPDRDGLLAAADQCPQAPEDLDGVNDEDGCPDLDDDNDLVPDVRDACPREPEDRDQIADEDGCPEYEPEDPTPVADCSSSDPRSVRACEELRANTDDVVQRTGVGSVEFGRVEYALGRGSALAASIPTLLAVRTILHANQQIERMRIEGHSDDTGEGEDNDKLSARRARSVARWLVERGIAIDRLEVYACSDLYPREQDRKHKGRQANRRVEFHVVKPAAEPHGHDECRPVPLSQ